MHPFLSLISAASGEMVDSSGADVLAASTVSQESSYMPVGSGILSGGFLNPVSTALNSSYSAPTPRGECKAMALTISYLSFY